MATSSKNSILSLPPPTKEELDSLNAAPAGSIVDELPPPSEEDLAFLETDIDKFPAGPDVQPTGLDKMLTDEDLKKVGAKYGVDPEKLRTLAPFWDTQVEPRLDAGSLAKQIISPSVGLLGRGVLLNVPQKLYQMAQDENTQKAIDELSRIGSAQKSGFEKAASFATEVAMPGGVIGATAKKAAARIAGAAATGAIAGGAGAESGKELQGAAIGTAIGGGLGSAGVGVAKALQKRADDVAKSSRQFQLDLEKAEEAIQKELRESEDLITPLVFAKEKPKMTPEEIRLVLKQQDPEAYTTLIKEAEAVKEKAFNAVRSRRFPLSTVKQAYKSALQKVYDKTEAKVNNIVDTRLVDFVSHATQKPVKSSQEARELLQDYSLRQNPEAVVDSYKEFAKLQLAKKAIEREGLVSTRQQGFIANTLDRLSDAQFVFRGMDQKYRTDIEGIHSDLNKNYNLSTDASKRFRQRVEDIFDYARKEEVDPAVVNSSRMYDALDNASLDKLMPKEKKVAEAFQQFFADVRREANKDAGELGQIKGLGIPELINKEGRLAYVPKRLVEHEELVRRMEKRAQEADAVTGGNLLNLTEEQLTKAAKTHEEVRDILRAITLFDDRPVTDGKELGTRLKKMLFTRDGYIALQTKAKAAMERTNRIEGVDFLLEKNLYKLAQEYAENTMKHKYLRKPLEQLRFQEQRLRALGADTDAEYVRKLNEDMLGIRKDTMAETTSRLRKGYWDAIDRRLAETKNPVTKGALYAAKAFPSLILEASRQIYPNVLGFYSIRAVVQNLTQPFTKLAPELGTIYGKQLVARGAVNLINDWKRIMSAVEVTGQIPAEFTKAGERAIADGILRSAIYRVPKDTVDGMARVGMALFAKGEQINRGITWAVGEQLAKDYVHGNKSAIKAISQMSPYVQSRIKKAGPYRDMVQVITGYLNDKTMYNYNRASMSEFGRTMGPFFSTFSKWPSATLGDMLQILRDKGALQAATPAFRKYVEPLIFLQSLDVLMGERNNLTEMAGLSGDGYTDRQKKLLGSSGLSQSAPIGAVGAIAKGEIFTPPALDAFLKTVVNPILDPRTETASDMADAALKGAADASMTFGPGAGLFRLLFEDIPTYVTGEKPEGRNTLERVIESMKKATE